MAGSELVVDEKYCKEAADYCVKQGEALEQIINEYIKLLDNVSFNGIGAGDAHDMLKLFISYAEKMKNQSTQFTDDAKKQILLFLQRIDEADQYLF